MGIELTFKTGEWFIHRVCENLNGYNYYAFINRDSLRTILIVRESIDKKVIFQDVEKHLRETAKKWSSHCCEEFDGEVLTKGLMISKAIVEFLNETEA